MAYLVMTHIVMAHIAMSYFVMAHIVMAYTVLACIVTAYIVTAYRVMAYIVMAPRQACEATIVWARVLAGGTHPVKKSPLWIAGPDGAAWITGSPSSRQHRDSPRRR